MKAQIMTSSWGWRRHRDQAGRRSCLMMTASGVLLMIAIAGWTTTTTMAAESTTKKKPPSFFLQDPSDSLCLAGDTFKRCAIDTLWYVVGAPGNYQIHKRPLEGIPEDPASDDDGMCLAKKSCKEGDHGKLMPAIVAKCSHCGAKEWNILGDADTGYVLTEGPETSEDGTAMDDPGAKTCLIRIDRDAKTASCESEEYAYTPLQLQFASASDIAAMSSPAARMVGAASDGDRKTLQQLVETDGIDINVRDWDELTALIPASSSGHLEIVKYLLGKGADVNAADKDGITSLMEAAIMGNTKVVEHLLENGADADVTAKSGVTALWLAAGEGKVDVLRVLLNKGSADATNARVDGITAIMTAAGSGHHDAVRLLLEKGADPTITDGDGLTPLMNAAENGNTECLRALVEGVQPEKLPDYVNAFSSTGFTALIIAAANGHKEACEYLVTGAGALVDAVHDARVSPLMYAAASDHVDVLKLLLDNGADKELKHTNGGTALLEAATGGAVEALRILIEAGADYKFVDDDGVSPLMAVASQGKIESQTLLLERLKGDLSSDELLSHINAFSYSGGSSVMFAAAGGHVECTRQLMDHGADVRAIARATPEYLVKHKKMLEEGTLQDDDPHVDGVTALHVAAQGGHLEAVRILIESGVDVSVEDDESRTALKLAIKGNYGEVAAELVKAGADPNTEYVDDEQTSHNLLMDAIIVENVDFARLLIENGADLYYKDDKGVTTLLQAAHRGLEDIVDLLLSKHEASKEPSYVDAASEDGVTAFIAASSEGHVSISKALVAAGADVNARDKDGTTALMAACARGNKEVVDALLEAKADVNVQNDDGHTALMFAYNGKNQVETLWERYSQYMGQAGDDGDGGGGGDGDGDDQDDGGTGPIIREAIEKHLGLVEALLSAGADPQLKDKEGHTAKDFDYNPDSDGVSTKEYKVTSGADGNDEL